MESLVIVFNSASEEVMVDKFNYIRVDNFNLED